MSMSMIESLTDSNVDESNIESRKESDSRVESESKCEDKGRRWYLEQFKDYLVNIKSLSVEQIKNIVMQSRKFFRNTKSKDSIESIRKKDYSKK